MKATAPACTIVIFGAAGDLTQRLLMPSIYNLAAAGLLDAQLRILGVDHNDRDAAGWRAEMSDALHRFAAEPGSEFHANIDEQAWSSVADRLDYVRCDFTNDADFDRLAERLRDAGNAVFYLAVSPRFFEPVAAGLARTGLLTQKDGVFRRLVVEKPFGNDVASARRLNARLTSLAAEDQIYRIDHFLGKEAVAGILVLRAANTGFELLLDRKAVAAVQITAAETVGVEERGGFYEGTGALRDMVPNHLFSLLTLVTMDMPATFDGDALRDAKMALLAKLQPVAPAHAVRGQYTNGSIAGRVVRAYRDEDDVARDSRTETYAALRLTIDNDRWRGVPFYLRTGKRMSAHITTIALQLRTPDAPLDARPTAPHLLVFGVDPQRGVVYRFAAKRPGVGYELGAATMTFRYDEAFTEPPNVGYESLLYDVMQGRPLRFQRADMIEREWTVLQDVLDAWGSDASAPQTYAAGGSGPRAGDELLARDGNRWLPIEPLEQLAGDPIAKPAPEPVPVG